MKSTFTPPLRATILLASLALGSISSARAATVTVTSGSLDSMVFEDGQGSANSFLPPTFPNNATQIDAIGEAADANTYIFSNNGFEVYMEHRRAGESGSSSFLGVNVLFMVQPDLPGGVLTYALSGDYSVRDANGTPGRVVFSASLVDELGRHASQGLFENDQGSVNTLNQSFTLGQTVGDDLNNLSGTLAGTLIAGHVYDFHFNTQLDASSGSDAGATAAGHIFLSFGDSSAAAVPLPAAAPVGFFMLAGCGAFAGLRRKRTCITTL